MTCSEKAHRAAIDSTTVDYWDWQLQARCRGVRSAAFFPPQGLRGETLVQHEAEAKRICGSCRVVEQCRQYALTAGEQFGIWGGLTAAERGEHPRGARRAHGRCN